MKAELDELELGLHHVLVVFVDVGLHRGFLGRFKQLAYLLANFDYLKEIEPLREVIVLD